MLVILLSFVVAFVYVLFIMPYINSKAAQEQENTQKKIKEKLGPKGCEILESLDSGPLSLESCVGKNCIERKWEKYLGDGLIYAVLSVGDGGGNGLHIFYLIQGVDGEYTYNSMAKLLSPGRPNVFVKTLYDESYTKNPDRLLFTSATVGGITTGGVKVIDGGYNRKRDFSGTYAPFIGFGNRFDVHNQAFKFGAVKT